MKLIVDGSNLVFRIASTALRLNSPWDGRPTEVVFNFLRMLHSVANENCPDGIVVVFDSKQHSLFRTAIFPDYKAHRPKRDPDEYNDIMGQVAQVRSLIETYLSVPSVSVFGIEADDLIYFFTNKAWVDEKVLIYSGDKDFYQLVSDRVKIYNGKEIVTVKNIRDRLGATPKEYLAARILSGDPSDGIPAVVKGMGLQTALELVQKYRSFREILRAADRGDLSTNKRKLRTLGWDMAGDIPATKEAIVRNKMLMDLQEHPDFDNGVILAINTLFDMSRRRGFHPWALQGFFLDHGMNSLLTNFGDFVFPFRQASEAWMPKWEPFKEAKSV